jgi:hypothetical protein
VPGTPLTNLVRAIASKMERGTPLGSLTTKEMIEGGDVGNIEDILRSLQARKEGPALQGTVVEGEPVIAAADVARKPSGTLKQIDVITGEPTGPGPPLVTESGAVPVSGEMEPGWRALDDTLPAWEEPPSKDYLEGRMAKKLDYNDEPIELYPGLEKAYDSLRFQNVKRTDQQKNTEAVRIAEEARALHYAKAAEYYKKQGKKKGKMVKHPSSSLPPDTKPPMAFGKGEFPEKSIGEELADFLSSDETKLTSGIKRQQRFDPTKEPVSPEEVEKMDELSFLGEHQDKEVTRIQKLLNELWTQVPAEGGRTADVPRIQRLAAPNLAKESTALSRINMAKRQAMDWLEDLSEETLTIPEEMSMKHGRFGMVVKPEHKEFADQIVTAKKHMSSLQKDVMDGWRAATKKIEAGEVDVVDVIDDFEKLLLDKVYGPLNPPAPPLFP